MFLVIIYIHYLHVPPPFSLVPNSRPNSLGEWVCSWTSLLWHERWPYGTDTQSFTVLSGFAREVWKNITLSIHKEGPSKICFPSGFRVGSRLRRMPLSFSTKDWSFSSSTKHWPQSWTVLHWGRFCQLVQVQFWSLHRCTVHWLLLLRAFGSFCACVCPTQWWQWVCQQFGVHSTPQKDHRN